MGFQGPKNKISFIMKLKPDVLIVQECANFKHLPSDLFPKQTNDKIWFGHHKKKGIGVLSFNNYKINLLKPPGKNDKWIVPIKVKGKKPFNLIAAWAMNQRKNDFFNGVNPAYATFIRMNKYLNDRTLIVGDLNDNVIWDNHYPNIGNFSAISKYFESKGIKSCYHVKTKETYGNETKNTIWWRKNIKTAYHIDYCFAGKEWIKKLKSFKIGTHKKWLKLSDHAPIIIDF
jgi:exodeoxyribonuclease-3